MRERPMTIERTLPEGTMIGPTGDVCYAPGGVLEPGLRAALALFELERKVAQSELDQLAAKAVADRIPAYEISQRVKGAEFALDHLREQAARLGIQL